MISPRNVTKLNVISRNPGTMNNEEHMSVKGLKRVVQNDSSFLGRLDRGGRGSMAAAPTVATSGANLFTEHLSG